MVRLTPGLIRVSLVELEGCRERRRGEIRPVVCGCLQPQEMGQTSFSCRVGFHGRAPARGRSMELASCLLELLESDGTQRPPKEEELGWGMTGVAEAVCM